ncbi:MAG: metal ABC transporter ATP-binding protein [Clostridia bacterium]|nr:metal ABC transporter ATP-binding protein [Clostridia bacterium]
MKIIEVENLKVSYSNHTAIENVSFSVEEGEYIALVGENGSGKSTLIKAIVGLEETDSGDVKINIPLDEVSYLSQTNLKDLDFPATAKEIIMTGVQKHKKLPFYTREDKQNYDEVIKKLKIEDIQNERIGDLSGGQKQRVLIARSLIKKPKLLILDEPVTGLDVNITRSLYKMLEDEKKNNNTTIIMATHDLDEIEDLKPRIIWIAKTIKYDGDFEGWKGF